MRKYFQPKIEVSEFLLRDLILQTESIPDTSGEHGDGGGGSKLTPGRLYV